METRRDFSAGRWDQSLTETARPPDKASPRADVRNVAASCLPLSMILRRLTHGGLGRG